MVEGAEPSGEETVSLTQRQYDAIMQRIAELEAREPQRPPEKAVKLPTGKPSKFNGERDDQKARLWLSEVDTQVRMHMRMDRGMKEEDKLIIAESFLGDIAREQYNSKISIDGPFTTYIAFRDWMLEAYAPSDLIAKYRTSYRSCRQKDGESIEDYYLRFTTIVSKLDKKPEVSWQVSDFVLGLRNEYAEKLNQFEDISTYENLTVKMVMERLSRSVRLSSGHPIHRAKASNANTSGSHERSFKSSSSPSKPLENRVSSNSKPKFKKSNGNKSTGGNKPNESSTALTSDQKGRIERLIASGGGQFVGNGIRDHPEWREVVRDKKLCNNCAAEGHIAKNCPLAKGKSSEQLNTFIPGFANHVNSQIQRDYEYFYSMAERTPLAMFVCSIAQSLGVVLLDCGATRNYISLEYAKRSQLSINRLTPIKHIRTPNGLL